MAIAKVCGIETEYGIVCRGADLSPVAASSLLINSYVSATARNIGWDFQDESPANDARGISLDALFAPEIESGLVNVVLGNGSRYYVDHAHPEMSIPEVRTAREAVMWDCAAEAIVRSSMRFAGEAVHDAELIVYKNNSDGKGNSYGCHENYLVDRALGFSRLAQRITPHLVTRQVFCGAGKVGTEAPGAQPGDVSFQLSQRADFIEEAVGLETTLKRPIVNTRDEPHCDADKYRRLHIIIGDANMSETATWLKIGTTAIVLAMIEDGVIGDEWTLRDPVRAVHAISNDPTLSTVVELADGRRVRALDVQFGLHETAREYAQRYGLDCVDSTDGARVLTEWGALLDALDTAPETAATRVDWVAKKRLVDGYAQRHQLAPTDARLRAIDLQYHDVRLATGLANRVGLDRLVDDAEIAHAVQQPPESTRAYFRGRCLQKYGENVLAANWDSMVFDTGVPPLRRVPMMEPLRGTAEHVANVIDESPTVDELLKRLGQ